MPFHGPDLREWFYAEMVFKLSAKPHFPQTRREPESETHRAWSARRARQISAPTSDARWTVLSSGHHVSPPYS